MYCYLSNLVSCLSDELYVCIEVNGRTKWGQPGGSRNQIALYLNDPRRSNKARTIFSISEKSIRGHTWCWVLKLTSLDRTYPGWIPSGYLLCFYFHSLFVDLEKFSWEILPRLSSLDFFSVSTRKNREDSLSSPSIFELSLQSCSCALIRSLKSTSKYDVIVTVLPALKVLEAFDVISFLETMQNLRG